MHTPGPWTYHRDEGTVARYTIAAERQARTRDGQTVPVEADLIADTRGSDATAAANARLIAASPEMLALLTDWPINMPAEAWNRWHTERRALLARIAGEDKA